MSELAPGAPPPKITVEVWSAPHRVVEPEQFPAQVADVVRIDDGWHVVVQLDG